MRTLDGLMNAVRYFYIPPIQDLAGSKQRRPGTDADVEASACSRLLL